MRLPIVHPYRKLKEWAEAGNELSVRKNVCYRFLRWAYSKDPEDKEEFVRVLKEWRKTEKRIGGHRTLLERKGRVIAKQIWGRQRRENARKAAREWGLMAAEKGIGMLSPEWQAKKKEIAIERERRRKELGLPARNIKDWIVHSPTGEIFYERGLRRISAEYGLCPRHLNSTKRHPGKTHKGWWVEPDDREWRDI